MKGGAKWNYVKVVVYPDKSTEKVYCYFDPDRDISEEVRDPVGITSVSPFCPDPCNEYAVHLPWKKVYPEW